jgi:hypothetical protein
MRRTTVILATLATGIVGCGGHHATQTTKRTTATKSQALIHPITGHSCATQQPPSLDPQGLRMAAFGRRHGDRYQSARYQEGPPVKPWKCGQPFQARPNFAYYRSCGHPCLLTVFPRAKVAGGAVNVLSWPCEAQATPVSTVGAVAITSPSTASSTASKIKPGCAVTSTAPGSRTSTI